MNFFSWLIVIVVAVNLIVAPYFLQLLVTTLAAFFRRSIPGKHTTPQTRFLVAIPAHNEEEGIAATVQSCLALEYPDELFQVVVIADNCDDGTAQIARREGALVLERHDAARKSKGYAIEFLIEQLHQSGEFEELDALVLIDADSIASPGLLRGFSGLLESDADWAQCYYTVSNPDESWRTRLLTYAFCLFNGVTPLGQFQLGLSAGFRGNGMCLSTKGLRRVPWACHGLVEDMEYSWTVRLAGEKIAFISEEHVKAVMLGHGGQGAAAQRRRWEFGRGELKRRLFGPIIRSRHLNLLEKVTSLIELTMPSMVAMAGLYFCLLVLNAWVAWIFWHAASSLALSLILAITIVCTLAMVLVSVAPFLLFCLSWKYLLVLWYFPIYAIWKFFIRLGGRPNDWVRTAREPTTKPKVGAASRAGSIAGGE
jgi:cellulose synthase/poly-beta-1,6-N-acetylglucosamine synthase-like glycosyltransferase